MQFFFVLTDRLQYIKALFLGFIWKCWTCDSIKPLRICSHFKNQTKNFNYALHDKRFNNCNYYVFLFVLVHNRNIRHLIETELRSPLSLVMYKPLSSFSTCAVLHFSPVRNSTFSQNPEERERVFVCLLYNVMACQACAWWHFQRTKWAENENYHRAGQWICSLCQLQFLNLSPTASISRYHGDQCWGRADCV